jgi:hypothetical protein
MNRSITKQPMLGPALLLCALALTAGFGTGCSDDGTKPEPKPTPGPLPVTADSLILLLRDAYTSMDIDAYRGLRHADFVFKFQQYDIDNLNLPADHLTRMEDLVSTQNLFSGQAVSGVPAVASITWPVLEGIGVWEASVNPEFPNTMHRLYNFMINITRPGATTIIITGQQEFYAASRDSLIDGTLTPYWELLGQVDLSDNGGGKATENATWGSVKDLYQPRYE